MKDLEDPVTYYEKLCEQLDKLDGRVVNGGAQTATRTFNGKELDPAFIDQIAKGLATKLRREGLI